MDATKPNSQNCHALLPRSHGNSTREGEPVRRGDRACPTEPGSPRSSDSPPTAGALRAQRHPHHRRPRHGVPPGVHPRSRRGLAGLAGTTARRHPGHRPNPGTGRVLVGLRPAHSTPARPGMAHPQLAQLEGPQLAPHAAKWRPSTSRAPRQTDGLSSRARSCAKQSTRVQARRRWTEVGAGFGV